GQGLAGLTTKTFRRRGVVIAVAAAAIVGAVALAVKIRSNAEADKFVSDLSSQTRRARGMFVPTDAPWAAITVKPVEVHAFRSELVTDGRISVDEDHSTPIFSPYSGLIKRLAVKLGDSVHRGELLFTLEATDMVQAQNDFITSLSALETTRSQLNLAKIIEK